MVRTPPKPGLLVRVYSNVEPNLEAWLVDICNFILIVVGLLLAHYSFRLLQAAGVPKGYVVWLENEELVADGIIYSLFLVAIVRRTVLILFSQGSSTDQNAP
jgi:hypothetical protein